MKLNLLLMVFLRSILSLLASTMSAGSYETWREVRLHNVEGMPGRFNDILFYRPKDTNNVQGRAVYFGGDVQDYLENMKVYQYSRGYMQWSLENTAALLQDKFPQWEVYIVKPSHMHLKTFSCYKNFVMVNSIGSPQHSFSTEGLQHLKLLLTNAILAAYHYQGCSVKSGVYPFVLNIKSGYDGDATSVPPLENPIILIGFSKGAVVLNQLLYGFYALDRTLNSDLISFVKQIKATYWLDGGHSGESNTWITDKKILSSFVKLEIEIYIHVSPYQVACTLRPWIGKEEKIFHETLSQLGGKISRTMHFETEEQSLTNHFLVLEQFTTLNCSKA
ncbi:mitochondrial protein C2orf69 homolog [Tachypleus tridentatus]|uniref:mitochondrial protein C2orf69 homolog n=1 Tax=Tachypleus tridentatus TaxID=6853 RepID=UPI003FD61B57